ncbi:MAG: alpha/beta hydrolase family protein [Armatimonadota bacterium]
MHGLRRFLVLCSLGLSAVTVAAAAQDAGKPTERGDALLAGYFRAETEQLERDCLADVKTLADWTSRREEYRRQLFEMLGLWPRPERTDLKAQVTGRTEHPDFVVENVHFQSRPGLYVTGNLYLPRGLTKPAPAVLYVCGHGNVKVGDVSYGAKTYYQHHGAWLARHGYVCLTIDTLQLGEIEGLHHGTYREGMWWWLARGYTPAGVEAWNSIRALDYLQSRPEVDGERLGVTGRSGGGAYSWWLAALDERVKAAVPVAGTTDLRDHVIDGVVEGHCDCMFMVNTFRWDYPQVAALVAPRPLLLSNTDKDTIFPLEGVVRTHEKVRRIYRLYGAEKNLGLLITEGPHEDTQDLQVPALRWFDRFLKEEKRLVETAAVKLFEPPQLRVFRKLPDDQRNTRAHEWFVAAAPQPSAPASPAEWKAQREAWMEKLRTLSFRGWPAEPGPLGVREAFTKTAAGVRLTALDFSSQQGVPLRLWLTTPADGPAPERLVLRVMDDTTWQAWLGAVRSAFPDEVRDEIEAAPSPAGLQAGLDGMRAGKEAWAWLAPRGVGPTAWDPTPKKQVQNRRRFYLLGQSLEGMQVWDVRRAVQALRTRNDLRRLPLTLSGSGPMGGVALYASLFEPDVARLSLVALPPSHAEGPHFLNVLRFMDMPAAVAMAAERSRVELTTRGAQDWDYPASVVRVLGLPADRLKLEPLR